MHHLHPRLRALWFVQVQNVSSYATYFRDKLLMWNACCWSRERQNNMRVPYFGTDNREFVNSPWYFVLCVLVFDVVVVFLYPFKQFWKAHTNFRFHYVVKIQGYTGLKFGIIQSRLPTFFAKKLIRKTSFLEKSDHWNQRVGWLRKWQRFSLFLSGHVHLDYGVISLTPLFPLSPPPPKKRPGAEDLGLLDSEKSGICRQHRILHPQHYLCIFLLLWLTVLAILRLPRR